MMSGNLSLDRACRGMRIDSARSACVDEEGEYPNVIQLQCGPGDHGSQTSLALYIHNCCTHVPKWDTSDVPMSKTWRRSVTYAEQEEGAGGGSSDR